MALNKDIVIRLLGDADSAVKAQKAAADAAGVTAAAYRRAEREFDRQQKAMGAAAREQQQAMESVGRGAMVAGAVVVAGLGLATKAAIDWESAWAGVRKTVDGTPAEMAELEGALRDLAGQLPATHAEIAAVAEAAGQLGIARGDIAEFTEVAIAMGVATNLSAEEAATALAQMMNVMRTAPGDIDRMGSTLVALGNAGASTEADILSMAQRLAGAGELIGASETNVLALASSMADMGIQAELGGGAMSRVMLKIYSAMQQGGEAAEGFAEVAGVSATDFAAKWRSSPVEAIDLLVQGLGRVKGEGGNVVQTLSDLGISGTQNLQVMLSLAGAGDQLTDALAISNEAWAANNALMNEANQRYETTAARLQMARNDINNAAIDIGGTLLPIVAEGAEVVADLARGFESLPGPLQDAVVILGLVAGTIGIVGGAAVIATPKIAAFRAIMQTLEGSSSGVQRNMGKLGLFMTGPWGIALGVATFAIGGLIAALGASSRASEEAAGYQRDLASAMRESGGAIDDNVRALAAQQAAEAAVGDSTLLEVAESLGLSLPRVTDALLGQRDAYEELTEGADAYLQNALELANFNTEDPSFVAAAERVAAFKDVLGESSNAMGGAVAENKRLAAATDETTAATTGLAGAVGAVGPTVESTYGSLAGYAAALGLSEDATEDLIKKTQELGSTLADFIDPLGAYTAMLSEKAAAEEEAARKAAESAGASAESWREFVVDTGFSFDEYMRRIEEQVAAQTNWQTNMLILAGRVSQGTLDELARMGPEGAPLVADLVNRSDAELDRFDDITALRSKEATDAWGAQLTMAAPVLAAIGKTAGQGVVSELAAQLRAGTITVAEIARQYGVNLAGGINPILRGLGKPNIMIGGGRLPSEYVDGGYTGPGGKYDPAGIVHAGEYVLTKEETSRLGIDRIEAFANQGYADGGFVTAADVPKPRSTAPFQPPISTAGDATMQKAYEEAAAWLAANVQPVAGVFPAAGPAGGGSVGGGYQGMFAAIRAAFPRAKLNSGFRAGDPGYHGRGRAVDLGEAGFSGGSGRPYIAAMNRWIHDTYGARSAELIYTGAGDDRPDLKNGRPLNYGAATNAQHRNHVHWAMASGGVIGEPVLGRGLRSGNSYSFGERGPETVLPGVRVGSAAAGGASGPASVVVQARVFIGDQELTDIVRVQASTVIDGREQQQTITGRSWGR